MKNLILSLLVAVPSPSTALTLNVTSSNFKLNYDIEDLGSGSRPVTLTGNIEIEIEANYTTDQITDFRFTGGSLHYSDGTASLSLPLNTTSTLTSTGVQATPTTFLNIPTINPDGTLIPAAHQLNFNSGTNLIITTQELFGIESELAREERDFTNDPELVIWLPTTLITADWEPCNALFQKLNVTLLHTPTAGREVPITIPGLNPTLVVEESGTYTATGSAIVPITAYQAWLTNASITASDISQTNPTTGEKLALLFALGLESNDQIPLEVTDGTIRLSLGSSITNLPFRIETSTSMKPGSWTTALTIEAGRTGLLQAQAPSATTRFARLALD